MESTGYVNESQKDTVFDVDLFVPLFQNFSASFSVFVSFCVVGYSVDDFLFLSKLGAMISVVVFSIITVIRFFGKTLGIYAAVYAAGRASLMSQVAVLEAENARLRSSLSTFNVSAVDSGSRTRKSDELDRVYENSKKLVSIAYSKADKSLGRSVIARDKITGQNLMSPSDWKRAISFLESIGVCNSSSMLSKNISDANSTIELNFATQKDKITDENFVSVI